ERVSKLSLTCGFSTNREELVRSRIVLGVTDDYLRTQLQQASDKSWSATVDFINSWVATRQELLLIKTNRSNNVSEDATLFQVKSSTGGVPAAKQSGKYRPSKFKPGGVTDSKKQQDAPTKKPVQCYRCAGAHFASECTA